MPAHGLPIRDLVVDVVRGCAIQSADPLGDEQRGRYCDRQVYMIGRAADGVYDDTGGFQRPIAKEAMTMMCHLVNEQPDCCLSYARRCAG